MYTIRFWLGIKRILILTLIFIIIFIILLIQYQISKIQAQTIYIGANLDDMFIATGVDYKYPKDTPRNAPWPQNANNYCFVAAVQALTNYAADQKGLTRPYPLQNDQGPANRLPSSAIPGQIIYDMNTKLIPQGGPLPSLKEADEALRRPYVLSNISYDFGGDPHTLAVALDHEVKALGIEDHHYHQHIFHDDPFAATQAIVQALQKYSDPVVVMVEHGSHSILVAGVWLVLDSITNIWNIDSLAIYNMWDQQHFKQYMNGKYYSRLPIAEWLSNNAYQPYTWFSTYGDARGLVADPVIGPYQAGVGTRNPNARHWLGNFVLIQRDDHPDASDIAFNDDDQPMTSP